MKLINIAIIDDGISDQCFHINFLKEHIIVDNDKIIRNASCNINKYSHGSICAALLSSNTDVFSITSIGMMYDNTIGGYHINSLISALKLCLTLDIDIVHLSLGIMDYSYYYDMLQIVNALHNKGVLIIAAADPTEKITIPACFANVLGVMYSPYVKNSKCFRYISNSISGIDVLVNVNEKITMKDGTISIYGQASSYAVPVICSALANFLPDINEVHKIKRKYGVGKENNIDWIDSPLIIIFSEEEKIILDDLVIFDSYTIVNVPPTNIDTRISKLINDCGETRDIIIIDNMNDDNSIFQVRQELNDFLSSKNVALLTDNTCFAEYVLSITRGRVYLSTDIASKTLIQNVANEAVQVFEIAYRKEDELWDILSCHTNSLCVSYDKSHMLYGIDYVPKEIQKSHVLLQKYISNLSYIHNKDRVCIIKKQ